jgi:hypothetical protein
MMPDHGGRQTPLAGLVFVGLLAATFALSWNTPDDTASGATVISYVHAHRSQLITANMLGAYAVVFWLFFAGSLRGYVRRAGSGEGLATTVLGSGIVFAVGVAILSTLGFTLANEINRLDASGAHTINLISNGAFLPLAAGQAAFAIASALALLRTHALPAWLGWLALVIGVVSLTPIGFFATLALLLWTAIVSVLVYIRDDQLVAAPVVTAPREPVGATTVGATTA